MTIQTNICILGAGPGGIACALYLANKGIPTVLIDKASFPRDKICGDAVSGKVFSALRKIDPAIVDNIYSGNQYSGSWGVNFIAPNGKELKIPFSDKKTGNAPAIITKRLDFDNILAEEARKHQQINFIEGIEITETVRHNGSIILSSKKSDLTVEAKLVIAANGAQSSFSRKFAGLEHIPRNHSAGLRAYYKGIKGLSEEGFIELHFIKDFLPGYFWIFPLPNGQANVGVGMRTDHVSKGKVNLKRKMVDIIEKHPALRKRFQNAEMMGDIQGFGLTLGSKKRKISGDNYLLVGDAAHLIDPFTGEGIGNAVISGVFAAEQAVKSLEQNNYSAAFLAGYDRQVYGRLWKELNVSGYLQRLAGYPWLFNAIVNKAAGNSALQETISCMFNDLDMRKKLKNPLFYLKLLLG